MPITSQTPLLWTIQTLSIDMIAAQASVTLSGAIGSQLVGTVNFIIPEAEFLPLITAMPTAGATRQNDITEAVYAYAIAQGIVSGVTS